MKKIKIILIALLVAAICLIFNANKYSYEKKVIMNIVGEVYDPSCEEFIGEKQFTIDGTMTKYPLKKEQDYFVAMIDVEGITRDYHTYCWDTGFLKSGKSLPLNVTFSAYDLKEDSNIYYFASLYTNFDFDDYLLILYDDKVTEEIKNDIKFEDLKNCIVISPYNNIEELEKVFKNRYNLLP